MTVPPDDAFDSPDDDRWLDALQDEGTLCEAEAVEHAGTPPAELPPVAELEPCRDFDGMRLAVAADGQGGPVDNTGTWRKVALRRAARTWVADPSVLDLFCGTGKMWAHCWRDLPYHGIDANKVFSMRLCEIAQCEQWVEEHDLAPYNVFDADNWGSPWAVVGRVLARSRRPEIAILATDGVMQMYQRGGGADHLARCYGVVGKVKAGGTLYDRYRDCVTAWLSAECERLGWTIDKVLHADNARPGIAAHTNYWAFKFERRAEPPAVREGPGA
jgi:hypothetical protein